MHVVEFAVNVVVLDNALHHQLQLQRSRSNVRQNNVAEHNAVCVYAPVRDEGPAVNGEFDFDAFGANGAVQVFDLEPNLRVKLDSVVDTRNEPFSPQG